MKLVSNFIANEDGVTAIEYGLIASLVAVAIIAAITALGSKMSGTFASITGNLK